MSKQEVQELIRKRPRTICLPTSLRVSVTSVAWTWVAVTKPEAKKKGFGRSMNRKESFTIKKLYNESTLKEHFGDLNNRNDNQTRIKKNFIGRSVNREETLTIRKLCYGFRKMAIVGDRNDSEIYMTAMTTKSE